MSHLNNIYYFIDKFNSQEIKSLDKKINIIYRNYKKNNQIKTLIEIKRLCKVTKRKFFLANNISLAIKLKLNGVYIPSFNKSLKIKYLKTNNFEILGSAHNMAEINQKKKQGVQKIFISPLFKISKSFSHLGIIRYNFLSQHIKNQSIALGGINKNNMKKLKMLKCDGFAAIRFFKNE